MSFLIVLCPTQGYHKDVLLYFVLEVLLLGLGFTFGFVSILTQFCLICCKVIVLCLKYSFEFPDFIFKCKVQNIYLTFKFSCILWLAPFC